MAWRAYLQGRALLRPSLFKRLLGVQLLVFAVLLGVLLALTVMLLLARGHGGLDKDLKLLAQALARASSLNPSAEGASAAAGHITALHLETADIAISEDEISWQVWRSDGTLLARAHRQDGLPHFAPDSLPRAERTEYAGWIVVAAWNPERTLYAVIAQSSAVTSRILHSVWGAMVLPTVVLASTVFLALWLAMRLGLKPLAQLAHQLATRAPDASAEISHAPPHYELAPMVQAINSLLRRVRALRAAEHGFFADAAHELRTPLAVINAQAHALTIAQTAPQRSAALQSLQGGVERAANVLDKLLTLARLDHGIALGQGQREIPWPMVDVATLVRDTLACHAQRTIVSRHELSLDAAAHLWASCDAPALAAALDNLVDNALRYTPAAALIRVRLTTAQARLQIWVEDSGPGIAAHERSRLFERFERGSNSDGIIGSGLGLAIVRSVAVAHQGRITLDSSPDLGGARFCIDLPLVKINI